MSKNNREVAAGISRSLGLIFWNLGRYKALEYHKRSLAINEELNDRVGLANDYSNIGNVLRNMGKYQEALDSHNKALKIHEELNNRVGLAGDYNNIGLVLDDMGRLQEALDSHNKALRIHEELNDRVGLARNYYNISFVLSKTNKDEALNSLYNALTILQEFERENNYRHPLMDKVNNRLSNLKG